MLLEKLRTAERKFRLGFPKRRTVEIGHVFRFEQIVHSLRAIRNAYLR
jgi:hypothetical protein